MNTKIVIPSVICAVTAFGAGYYMGGLTTGESAQKISTETAETASEKLLRQQLAIEKRKLADLIAAVGQHQDGRLAAVLEKVGETSGKNSPDPSGKLPSEDELRKDALEVLDSMELMLSDQSYYDEEVMERLQAKLVALSQRDDITMNAIMAKLSDTAGSPLGEIIVTALGIVKDNRVEVAAQNLVAEGDVDQRIAGLEFIDRMESKSPDIRATVLNVLASENDPRLINSALYALNQTVVGTNEAASISQSISKHLSSSDPETRRRSVIATAEWAANDSMISPVIAALSDSDPNVRAGAAFALGVAKVKADTSRAALVAALKSPQEDWAVRELAWRSLSQYPIDDRDMKAYSEFSRQYESVQEAKISAATASSEHDHDSH